jgi:photosystem II stability/assembly factor-like uncharacterized protein
MVGPTDGWAVGDGGVILRYSNGLWTNFPSPTTTQLNSVFFLDSTHGWAAGNGGTILHYDGTIWLAVATSISTDLNSIVPVSAQEAWAVGKSATILHWTGISWNPVSPSPSLASNPDLNSIFMTSSNFGLIVGTPVGAGGEGTVLRVPQLVPIPEFGSSQIPLIVVFIAVSAAALLYRNRKNGTSRSTQIDASKFSKLHHGAVT